ncbi:hypothetical protein HHI36_004849 [Cryptolaemus montrouzieri]|uniref:Uncharacterized protein n=1 Tax=Cryptolaemus montrouzieri TaxID=559131 RepID=A0ABD2NSF0_9CUCU
MAEIAGENNRQCESLMYQEIPQTVAEMVPGLSPTSVLYETLIDLMDDPIATPNSMMRTDENVNDTNRTSMSAVNETGDRIRKVEEIHRRHREECQRWENYLSRLAMSPLNHHTKIKPLWLQDEMKFRRGMKTERNYCKLRTSNKTIKL